MKIIVQIFISLIIASMIVFCSADVHGQNILTENELKVQTMSKGEVAKFDGMLFSIPLVVKMKVEKSFLEQKCNEQIRYEVKKSIAKWKAKLEKNTIRHEAVIKKLKSERSMLNEQLDFCHEKLEDEMSVADAWYESPYFWFPVGAIIGSGLTIAVVYAVNQ